jgi:hypothetical protein
MAVLVVIGGWFAWQAWHAMRDLQAAESSANELRSTLDDGSSAGRDRVVAELQASARSARDRTDGPLWGALTHLPLVGDDVRGVRALGTSLDTLATDGLPPLLEVTDGLDGVTSDGRIDLDAVAALDRPVGDANQALQAARSDVDALDTSGYAGPLKSRFRRYVDLVTSAARGLAAGEKAVEVLPSMAGADGPRDYLLVFQNNAEIRATGGMPGSWALVHADAGELSIQRQGTAGDFGGERSSPVLPLSSAELAVYDRQLGTYFQDANFTPDFPRAAQLWSARWDERFPDTQLDGVLSVDPVAMSYLLRGTGPIDVQGQTLTAANLVDAVLSRPYLELEPEQQDALFAAVARALFDGITHDLASPVEFVAGLDRAAREGRFLVEPFDRHVRTVLQHSTIRGALTSDDGQTPHVDLALNDATGSKMSYYLRYWTDVDATGCADGRQALTGSITFKQAIDPRDAAELPESVTGTGDFGTERGSQLVLLRLYGPFGGSFNSIRMDGKAVRDVEVVDLDGRPVATVVVLLSNRDDVTVTWAGISGQDQTGPVRLGVTPSVVAGDHDETTASAC